MSTDVAPADAEGEGSTGDRKIGNARLYVLVRSDAETMRNIGMAAAQTSHSANQMVYEAKRSGDQRLISTLHKWEQETPQGFGTAITLDVGPFSVLEDKISKAQLEGLHANLTRDPEYPVWDGDVLHLVPFITCGYVFGEYDAVFAQLMGGLPLLGQRDHAVKIISSI